MKPPSNLTNTVIPFIRFFQDSVIGFLPSWSQTSILLNYKPIVLLCIQYLTFPDGNIHAVWPEACSTGVVGINIDFSANFHNIECHSL